MAQRDIDPAIARAADWPVLARERVLHARFLEAEGEAGEEPIDALYRRIGAMLAEDAKRHEILASALVANAGLPAGFDRDFDTAISVLVEAPEFCRSVVGPYRAAAGGIILGKMIPEEAEPAVFA